jgi:mRNA interferase MazF
MKQPPARGELWFAELDPVRGREQAGTRPALVISVNPFNQSGAELAIVIPLTSKDKQIRTHVPIEPSDGGVRVRSFVKCEDVRSIAQERFERRIGSVGPAVLSEVEKRLRLLMGL